MKNNIINTALLSISILTILYVGILGIQLCIKYLPMDLGVFVVIIPLVIYISAGLIYGNEK